MKIQNKTILIVDGKNEVALTLATYLRARNNKIVWFGSDEQKQKPFGQTVQDFKSIAGRVSNQESVQKLYDYFGKGFQPIDVIVQVCNGCKADRKIFASHNHQVNVKAVKGDSVHTTAEWGNDILSPENLQEYFIPIMLREREALVITIFREKKKRNFRYILSYLRSKFNSPLYSRRVRDILSNTHIKVTDVFVPDSKVSESVFKGLIEAVEKGKNYVYL